MPKHEPIVDNEPPLMNHWYIPGAPMTLCALPVNNMKEVRQHGIAGDVVLCQICFSILKAEIEA